MEGTGVVEERAGRARGLRAWVRSTPARVAAGLASLVALVVLVARIDLEPSLRHLDATLFSGDPQGDYHALGARLAELAERLGGRLENVPTQGSLENLERLADGAQRRGARFALLQEGIPLGAEQQQALALVARLPSEEVVFFLGRRAGRVRRFADLAGQRIGIGPAASGTARVAREVLESPAFAGLGLRLEHHALGEQLLLLERGALDLGVFVISPEARLVAEALTRRGLEVASFEHAHALTHSRPHLRSALIRAGRYDPVRVIPAEDRHVLALDTLVVSDRRAPRSAVVGLLSLLEGAYPGLVKHNRERRVPAGLSLASATRDYLEEGGPGLLDRHAPWLVDLLPLSNLVYLVMAVSVLFNVMAGVSRFGLWRVDARRIELERRFAALFGSERLLAEVARLRPAEAPQATPEQVSELIHDLDELRLACRARSVSIFVPMGKELGYRYQEGLIEARLAALRAFEAGRGASEAARTPGEGVAEEGPATRPA